MSPRAAWRLEALGFQRVYEYAAGKVEWMASAMPREGRTKAIPYAGDVADQRVARCPPEEPVRRVAQRVEASPHSFAVVLNDAEVLLGRLSTDATDQWGDARACDVMDPGPVTIRANQPVAAVAEWMPHHNLHTVLVTTPQGRFVGLVDRDGAERAGSA